MTISPRPYLLAPYIESGNGFAKPLELSHYSNETVNTAWLKRGIWLYFLLLIFEGAIRKWIFPSLATPLLIVRDPIALYLIVSCMRSGSIKANVYLNGIVVIGFISIVTAMLFGHGNLWVALYGGRIMLIHFPMMFIMGRIFNRDDVIKMGKVLLWISIPMAVLIAMQFYSPQSAWVNRGVGGNLAGAGFDGALGYFRPPGTFSFTNGTTSFYGLAAVFIFYFLLDPAKINKLVLIGAAVALFAAIPLSISRSLFFQVGVTFLFTLMVIARKPKFLGKIMVGAVICLIALMFLNNKSFFQTATGAFSSRFEAAGDAEGGLKGTLGTRYLGGLLDPIIQSFDNGFFGAGLGMGTNVGSMLLSGTKGFLIAEGEWARLTGELGPLMGLCVIFLRLGLTIKLAVASYRRLVVGDLLPWLLLSFGAITVSQAQWAQPTALGFSTLIGGLWIASLKRAQKQKTTSTTSRQPEEVSINA